MLANARRLAELADPERLSAEDLKCIQRAIYFFRRGKVAKALRALRPSRVADVDDAAILAALRDLYPARAVGELPPVPASAPLMLALEPDEVVKALSSIKPGTAPGPSGWRAEHLAPVMHDRATAEGVCALVRDIINGVFAENTLACALLTMLRVIAFEKPGHAPPARIKLRPLGIGELLTKIAELVALRRIDASAADLWHGMQLGVGASGGAERALLELQHALEREPDTIAFLVDARNAYNALPRSTILREFFSQPQFAPAYRLVHFLLNKAAPAIVMGRGRAAAIIASVEGVTQGGCLSPVLFAWAVHRATLRTAADHPNVTLRAVIDDTTLVGRWPAVLRAAADLKERSESDEFGVKWNADKTIIVWPGPGPPPLDLVSALPTFRGGTFEGVKIVRGADVLLGGIIGSDDERRADDAMAKVEDLIASLAFIKHESMPRQMALNLLRLTVTRTSYLQRTAPTRTCAPALEVFDRHVRAAVFHLASVNREGLDASEWEAAMIALPAKRGGLGIPSAAATAPGAFVAAQAGTFPALARMHGHATPTAACAMPCPVTPSLAAVRDSLALITDAIGADTMEAIGVHGNADLFVRSLATHAQQRPHLQRTLKKALDAATAAHVLDAHDAPLHFKALIRTASKFPGSAGWLHAVPDIGDYEITNVGLGAALAYTLGRGPRDYCDSCPLCGGDTVGHPTHFLDCARVQGRGATTRHNNVVDTITAIWRSAGSQTIITEPRYRIDDSNGVDADGNRVTCDVPDAAIMPIVGDGTINIDVSFVNTTAPSYADRDPTAVVKQRAARKHSRYRDLIERSPGHSLVPFVMTTTGGLGPEAEHFVKTTAAALGGSRAWGPGALRPGLFAAYLRRRLSCLAVNAMGAMALEWRRGSRAGRGTAGAGGAGSSAAGQQSGRAAGAGTGDAEHARYGLGGHDAAAHRADYLLSEIELAALRHHRGSFFD